MSSVFHASVLELIHPGQSLGRHEGLGLELQLGIQFWDDQDAEIVGICVMEAFPLIHGIRHPRHFFLIEPGPGISSNGRLSRFL